MSLRRMTGTLLAGVNLLLALSGWPAHADDKSAPAKPEQTAAAKPDAQVIPAPPVVDAPYLLAGDDVINITVVNFPNLSQPQVTIPPDGKLGVPLLDPFSVLGKTTGEVKQELTTRWKRYLVNPSVSVSLVTRRKENVLVYGAVQRPGTVDYKPPMHVLEALAQAGGPLLQGNSVVQQGTYLPEGDLSRVVVTHKDGQKQTINLDHPELRHGTADDIMLMQGDVVYVPENHKQVSVVGEVLHPGTVDYRENFTVEDAITGAGGIKIDTSDLAAAVLTRNGTEMKLDLDALYNHGDPKNNVKLEPGDQVLIPEIRTRTFVFGDVQRPGYYKFKPGDRIVDALNGVGGTLPDANLARINLIHISKDKKTATGDLINFQKFFTEKKDANRMEKYNPELNAGDVIFVPQKKMSSATDVWGLLSGFNLVTGIGHVLFHGL
jgi:polysaccharide export outer membrane protein